MFTIPKSTTEIKECGYNNNKPPIWEWFVPTIYGDGLSSLLSLYPHYLKQAQNVDRGSLELKPFCRSKLLFTFFWLASSSSTIYPETFVKTNPFLLLASNAQSINIDTDTNTDTDYIYLYIPIYLS